MLKMGIKEKVLDLLKEAKEGITVKDIAKELNIRENAVNMYITRLKNEKKITKKNIIGKKNRYIIYSIKENNINLEKLKESYIQLNNLFKELIKNSKQLIKDKTFFKQLIKDNINIDLNIEVNKFLGLE